MSKNMPFWLCQVEVVSVMIAMNVIEELTVDEQECIEHCDIGEEVTEHVEIVETSDSLICRVKFIRVMAAMDVNSWGITVEEAETRFLYRRISWSRRTAGFRNRIGLVVS